MRNETHFPYFYALLLDRSKLYIPGSEQYQRLVASVSNIVDLEEQAC